MPSPRASPSSERGPKLTRRAVLGTVATGIVGSLAGCQNSRPPLSLPRWWRQYGYDGANTAYNPHEMGPTEPPVVEWTLRAGSYTGSSQPLSTPRGTITNTGDDGIYLLDGGGSVRWHDEQTYDGVAPAVPDSLVLPTDYGFRGVGRDGGIDVLGHRTAYEHWRTHTTHPESPPSVAGNLLVAGIEEVSGSRGRVVAFDVRNGEREWAASVETSVVGAPAIAADSVFVADHGATDDAGSDYRSRFAYAFDRETGDEHWRTRLPGTPWASVSDAPVYENGRVHLSAGPASVVTLDADDGDVLWHRKVGHVQASPALADGVLFAPTVEGDLVALDAESGETRWTEPFEEVTAAPVIVGEELFVVGVDGRLAAFGLDGTLHWDRTLAGEFVSSPLVDHMTVYVGTRDGTLYSVGMP